MPAIPFRGIQPFRYADHAIFFEREEETRQLASLVAVFRGVLLYGDSGNGKSSLINAGLLPRATDLGLRPERLRVSPRAGEEIVIERIKDSDDRAGLLPSLFAASDDDRGRIVLAVETFEAGVRDACTTQRPLLVFDQFEEILTLFDSDEARASRRRLVEMLVRLLREPLAVKLVFAFREDYLGKVKQLFAACPELVDQALRLGPPQAGALPAIIRGPFERYPGHFARELAPALAERLKVALQERFGAGDLSLSEVQTVCLRLWQAPGDPGALLAQKGVQGLLEDYLGEALDALAPGVREAAVALLSQMVTSEGTRNVISADDLVQRVRAEEEDIAPELLEAALDQLESESKLVRRERRRDLYLYEITSEFLVPWISRRREEQQRGRERRRDRRRLRVLASIAAALLVVAAVVGVVAVLALQQRSEAQEKGREAQRQGATATSLALVAAARDPLAERPDVSLMLAFEAHSERALPEARGTIIQSLRAVGRPAVVGILHGHDGVDHVAYSPDGRTLATTGGASARLWNAGTRTQVAVLTHPGGVWTGAFSPDGRTLATGDNRGVLLWDIRARRRIARLADRDGIADIAFSSDGRTLATAGHTGAAGLWDLRSGRQLARFGRDANSLWSVAFSPDGRTLATVGSTGAVRLWDTRTHTQITRLAGRGSAVAYSPDGQTLATADSGGTRLWSTRTLRQLARLGPSTNVAFSPDGRTLVTSHESGAHLWSTRTREHLAKLAGAGSGAVAFSPDGRTFATVADMGVRLWDATPHERLTRLTGHATDLESVAFSPDGRTLATADDRGIARMWDTRTGTELARVKGHDVAFSPDGQTLATAGDGARLWVTRTSRQRARFAGLSGEVAFSPDGRTLATTSRDNSVRLRDVRTHEQLARLPGHSELIFDVAYSPDGRTLATASEDGTVRLWDTRSHEELARLEHKEEVIDVEFSPDGRTVATAGFASTAVLWDARTHRPLARLAGHGNTVRGVAFSRDGQTLATVSSDRTVRLWDPRTHKHLARLTGHTGEVWQAAFSPDGRTLATASSDRSARLWTDIHWRDGDELRKLVCGLVGTGLSRADWDHYVTGIPYRNSCR